MTIRSLVSAALSARSLRLTQKLSGTTLFAPSKTQPLALAAIIRSQPGPLVVITSSGRQTQDLAKQMPELIEGLEVVEVPSWETLPHERLSPAPETVGRRVKAFRRIAEADFNGLVLVSVRAALQPVVANIAKQQPIRLEKGGEYLLPELALKLIEFAYERVDLVTRRGEFTVRGGILMSSQRPPSMP